MSTPKFPDMYEQLTRFLEKQGAAEDVPLSGLVLLWTDLTGLDVSDAMHCSAAQLFDDLQEGVAALDPVIGLIDDDEKIQEAACRAMKKFTIVGPQIDLEGIKRSANRSVEWTGVHWVFISDAKMRLQGEAPTFKEAVAQVRASLG